MGTNRVAATVLLAVASLLAACGDAQPAPTAAVPPTALAMDRATCVAVERDVCSEVLAAAVNNLARNQSAFRPPATVVQGACRDAVPDYAKGSTCWYVTLPLAGGEAPQVIMTRRHDGVIAQVGGDAISGQLLAHKSMSPAALTVDASPRALTESQAVEAALNADGRPGMSAVNVEFGPASQVVPREGFEWADVPSGDTWVWLIVVSDDGPPLGQEGSFIVLDYIDGTVYGIQRWIS